MEERLKKLTQANQEGNRPRWPLERRKQGKKVIGLFCAYVPEEIISAAGMLPFRVSGVWREDVSRARVYRPVNSCLYCTHVLEGLLSGELDFLDGVVATDWDDDTRRLADVCLHVEKPPFVYLLHVPRQDSELAYRFFASHLAQLAKALEELGGKNISQDSLLKAIETQNRTRELLMELYELRKGETPPLSGSEMLGLTTAATVMPKEEFNRELESLWDYIRGRKAPLKKVRPRLLVASDRLDNPAYLKLIEDLGALVAMDDLDTGSRYLYQKVAPDRDPFYALARRYVSRPPCPRMYFWDRQVEQVIKWVKDFHIDGVIHLPQMYSYNRTCSVPYFTDRLTEAGVPLTTILREYHLTNVGQLRTRIEAFIEMLEAR